MGDCFISQLPLIYKQYIALKTDSNAHPPPLTCSILLYDSLKWRYIAGMQAENSASAAENFTALIRSVTGRIAGRPLDADLEQDLNNWFPVQGPDTRAVFDACRTAIAQGWMCNREAGGIKFGRVVKPTDTTHGFSVDVVDMQPLAGPHHRHPNGEIDLIMPLEPDAKFDGRPAGWLVYGPGSAHSPTVTGGRALVLYLLPAGAIEFTKS
jgi:Domain of unknown function (DUF4863)